MIRHNARVSVTTPHPALRLVSLGLVAFVFTFLSLEPSLAGYQLAPLWFPTSIMLVAFYRHSGRMWPAIALACTLGNVAATAIFFPQFRLSLLFPALNIIEAVAGALLLRRLIPHYNPLQNLNSWLRLALGGAIIPPLLGGALLLLFTDHEQPGRIFFIWVLSESIGALALLPPGVLYKSHYLLRHRNQRLLLEFLLTLLVTIGLSWFALYYLPWPFTFIIVLLIWSAIRLPRLEAFSIFLATVIVVSLIISSSPWLLDQPHSRLHFNTPWLPSLMFLLPANVMTMVMYSFRKERKNIGESEARFRNAMEYSAIGMALVSTEGHWLQANKALCNLLGYTRHQLRALTFQQITWPEDLPAELEQLEQLRDGKIDSYSLEKRYYTRRGELVWTLLAVSVVRHNDGSPLYYIAQIEDITDLKQTEQINKRLMERITLANEAGGIGIWEWDLKPDVISWDKRMFELYELSPEIKPTYQLWKERLVKEDVTHAEKVINEALHARQPFTLEFRIRVKAGLRHIRTQANRVINPQDNVDRLVGISLDMTEVKQLNEALFQEKERLHITLDSIGEAVICTDNEMKVTFMNPVAEEMSGWSQQRAIGQAVLTVLEITVGENGQVIENLRTSSIPDSAIEQNAVLHCRSGNSYDIHYSVTPLNTLVGQNIGFVIVIQDVTESRQMLRQLSYSATHDGLTQLANRASFEKQLKQLLKSVAKTRRRHALVFIDLDRFKAVNDNAGHAAGDALLRELASLMSGMLRTDDILARLGGDEFALLLPDCSPENARTLASRLIKAINSYDFKWQNHLHRIGASAGVTCIDEHNNQAPEVMSQADIACYASKNSGRGVVTVYEPQQQRMLQARRWITPHQQRQLIEAGSLTINARIVASPRVPETAILWLLTLKLASGDGEMVDEQTLRAGLDDAQLQLALDRRVFSEFFSQWAPTIARKGISIALPLSRFGLASSVLAKELLTAMKKAALPPRLLHLMLAGDLHTPEDEKLRANLQKLHDAGCRIVLTHSGRDLTLFNRIPAHLIDYIMLNPELVSRVHTSLMDEMMVAIIHGHARRMRLQSIAGPANHPLAMETLSGIGIDLIFGDAIAPPQPLAALLDNSAFAIN